MLTNSTDITIEEWTPQHARWSELRALVAQLNQTDWFTFTGEWHFSSHVLVARLSAEILGFLRFVIQDIGPDMDCPPIEWKGEIFGKLKSLPLVFSPLGVGKASDETSRKRFGNGRKS